jgi:hypothetical protein
LNTRRCSSVSEHCSHWRTRARTRRSQLNHVVCSILLNHKQRRVFNLIESRRCSSGNQHRESDRKPLLKGAPSSPRRCSRSYRSLEGVLLLLKGAPSLRYRRCSLIERSTLSIVSLLGMSTLACTHEAPTSIQEHARTRHTRAHTSQKKRIQTSATASTAVHKEAGNAHADCLARDPRTDVF